MADTRPIIFLAFANDQANPSRYLRGLAAELRGLRDALQPARRSNKVEIVERANATLGEIFDVFQDPAYKGRIKVFHFGGHADSYRLLFESDRGNAPQEANAAAFGRFLAGQEDLELVFLNACATAQQAIDLRAAGVPAVIATDHDVNDAVATRFAIRFYRGLGAHLPISKAYNDAQQETLVRLDPDEGFRGLYWKGKENRDSVNTLPWKLYPQQGSIWKLPGGVQNTNAQKNPLIGPYAQYLVNRYEQDNEFTYRFLLTAPQGEPKIYIVHGPRSERHESLVKRFTYEYIGGKGYLEPVDIGVWPVLDHMQGRTNLRSDLAKAFDGLDWDDRTLSLSALDIVNLPSLRGKQAVVIQHLIPEEQWSSDTAKLIEWYIETFWKIQAVNPEAPRPVIFINVLYNDEPKRKNLFQRFLNTGWSRLKISQSLQAIVERNADNSTLLTELYQIERSHVEEWLQTTNLVDIEPFTQIPEQLFPPTKTANTLSMATVERNLKDAIDAYNRKEGMKLM